jgi:hypothetical protein
MKKTTEGSLDGFTSETFRSGKTYDLPRGLALTFIERDAAEEMSGAPANPDGASSGAETTAEGVDDVTPIAEENATDADAEAPQEVTMEPTSDRSPYYQFRDPDGDLITEIDDGDEKVIKVLGESNAEEKRDELQALLTDE